jgi:4-hydroxythreonine-4-phosphate dehydrogenase
VTGKVLALTMGDPAGIGPEIIVKAWRRTHQDGPPFVVVGDHDLLSAAPEAGGVPLQRVPSPDAAGEVFAEAIPVLDLPVHAAVVAGKPSPAHAAAVMAWSPLRSPRSRSTRLASSFRATPSSWANSPACRTGPIRADR